MPRIPAAAAFALVVTLAGVSNGADWPMARFGPNRGGATPEALAPALHLHWMRDYPRLEPAFADQAKMQSDVAYVPIVLGKTLVLASSRHDWVTGLDTSTGAEKWRY